MSIFENFGKKEAGLEGVGMTTEEAKKIAENPALFAKFRAILLAAGIVAFSASNVEAGTPSYKGISRAGEIGSVESSGTTQKDSVAVPAGWGEVMDSKLSAVAEIEDKIKKSLNLTEEEKADLLNEGVVKLTEIKDQMSLVSAAIKRQLEQIQKGR